VFDDPAEALGNSGGRGKAEGDGIALDVMGGATGSSISSSAIRRITLRSGLGWVIT
jgi:hypothetical protein